jgi:hypothetical protein
MIKKNNLKKNFVAYYLTNFSLHLKGKILKNSN